jgi:hypothetical protein
MPPRKSAEVLHYDTNIDELMLQHKLEVLAGKDPNDYSNLSELEVYMYIKGVVEKTTITGTVSV